MAIHTIISSVPPAGMWSASAFTFARCAACVAITSISACSPPLGDESAAAEGSGHELPEPEDPKFELPEGDGTPPKSRLPEFGPGAFGTHMEGWPDGFRHVEIDSPLDATVQDAVFRRAMSDGRPLAVVLHTWSGSFETQSDSLYQEVLDRDWNYIYPDFRGANDTPKACCSLSALTDLDAAIDFALEHTDALPSEVHVIGASGGGYAALCLLMRSKHRLPYVGAWVPITDLLAWHDESLARANGYDEDIRLCTSGDEEVLHVREARHRSPLYMRARLPPSNTVIQLYAGIDDGYTGSVPISHTLEFFNRLLDDFGAPEPARVPPEHFALLVDEQRVPSGETTTGSLDDREILYHRDHGALSVDIFDGGHEMLQHAALDQAGAATGVE